jgi:hypothetical protein
MSERCTGGKYVGEKMAVTEQRITSDKQIF